MLYRIIQKATLPATRRLIFNTCRVQFQRNIYLTTSKSSIHTSAKQLFASSHDWQQTPAPQHPLIEKIQKHPHIMQQLVDFTQLLQSKGVDVSGKQPSFMQIMKVMNDPEIKEKVQKLAQEMQAAGIQLDMQAIQELQSNFSSMSANTATPQSTSIIDEKQSAVNEKHEHQQQGEKEHGRKRGVMNRVKGLFKK
ncbi:hypothetical protein INT46_006541 [Mucor plumbeus]|jgi:hypothetical protein|uniref:Uncharacterized protein n=1 Tax=Mucor plumbeus TaxID=97098 RepID=A0A8H7RR37_9FUNG|nr:hypothetical protein INT46_006541 [Mucor plumbeus]